MEINRSNDDLAIDKEFPSFRIYLRVEEKGREGKGVGIYGIRTGFYSSMQGMKRSVEGKMLKGIEICRINVWGIGIEIG